MSQSLISTEHLVTESDVEQKVIYPLLSGGNFLAIQEGNIRTKEYMAPSRVEKGAGRSVGHYPDYTVWDKAFPLMVVEAKKPDVAVEVGYREGTGYAQYLNQRFRTGVNPTRFVISCNGKRVQFGYWDSEPVFDEPVEALAVGSAAVERLKGLCGQAVLAVHAAECLRTVVPVRSIRPFHLAGGQALLNSKKAV